jgi:hypothetical protein
MKSRVKKTPTSLLFQFLHKGFIQREASGVKITLHALLRK